MDGYIWRVPTLFGAIACSALVLFAAAVLASVLVGRRPSTRRKIVTRAALPVLAILAAFGIRATATRIAQSLDISVSYVDPGLPGYLAPLALAAFAFAVGDRLLEKAWTGRRALLFYAWLLVFTSMNVINWCSPGWCTTIGFPLPWLTWSDAIMTIGDGRVAGVIAAVGKLFAAALDLLTFVGAAVVLTRVCNPRRTSVHADR